MSRDMTAAEALEWALSLAEWPFPIPRKAIEERAAELRAQAAASPAPEPVGYVYREHGELKGGITKTNTAIGSALYTAPPADERVKELEGLLHEALPKIGERSVLQMQRGEVTIYERIRAALGGG